MAEAIIGFGANLGKPEEAYAWVKQQLPAISCELLLSSRLYRSHSLDARGSIGSQPDYLNAALRVETKRSPEDLLEQLLELEQRYGRVRTADERWQPRVLDLDLLSYGNRVQHSKQLTLPHPDLAKRDFVLVPIAECAPAWQHPVLGKTAETLYKKLPESSRTLR